MAGLLVTTSTILAGPLHAQATFAYEAVVGSNEALFTFPLPERTDWSWNDSTTLPGRFEYRWDVTVAESQHTYRVGFLQARFPGAAPAHGTLAQLLEAGQRSFFVFDGKRGTPDPGVGVGVVPGRDRLWVYIRDPDAVARLFGNRPASVTFHSLVKELGSDSSVVPVTYLKAGEPALPDIAARLVDPLPLGGHAPDFELPVLAAPSDGVPVRRGRLSEHLGHPVVLYLWFGSCPVARGEFPELARFSERWAARGVRFLGIAVNDTGSARAFLQAQRTVRFPYLGATADLPKAYDIGLSPTIIVIDQQGRIVHRGSGAGQLAPGMILEQRLGALAAARPALSDR